MGNKRSSKTGYKNNLNLYVVSYVFENGKLPTTSMKKSTFQYHLNKLKSDGVLFKKGYGVWSVDKDKFEALCFQKEVQKQGRGYQTIRGHGFHWKLSIPSIVNWVKREEYLKKKLMYYNQNRIKGQRIIIKGYKIWLFDTSIIIYNPRNKSFFEESAKGSYQEALRDILTIIEQIESKLQISFKINQKYMLKPSKQHYAHIENELAKEYNDNKKKLYIKYNEQGWLLIDKSLGVNELETIHSKTAISDMDKVLTPFFNDLKEHREKTGESLTISGLLKVIYAQQEQISSLLYKKPESLKPRDSYFG
jgi:hypothetical protein